MNNIHSKYEDFLMLYSLRIFSDLVKTGSFTKAASLNYITQSAVSHHISSLEENLGHRLVNRTRKSAQLTEAGKKVHRASIDMLHCYERLKKSLSEDSVEIAGLIRIATSITVGLHELPVYSKPFIKKYSKTHIQLIYLKIPDIYEHVVNGRADLGLVAFPQNHPQIKLQVFKKNKLVIIMPPTFPSCSSKTASLRKLFQNPSIFPEKSLPARKTIDRILDELGIRPNIAHVFDEVESMKQAVETGLGIAIVPEITVEKEVELKRLKKIPVPRKSWEYTLAIATRKNTELNAASQAFIEFILSDGNA